MCAGYVFWKEPSSKPNYNHTMKHKTAPTTKKFNKLFSPLRINYPISIFRQKTDRYIKYLSPPKFVNMHKEHKIYRNIIMNKNMWIRITCFSTHKARYIAWYMEETKRQWHVCVNKILPKISGGHSIHIPKKKGVRQIDYATDRIAPLAHFTQTYG